MEDDNPQMSQQILLAVGARGLTGAVPGGVQLVPVGQPVESGEALSVEEQQRLVRDALERPLSVPPLRELANGHRRTAILVGDLSLPAPYDIALPPVIATLLEAEIRPSRICILACPGSSGPVLGSAAIHRYGEEIVGQYELRAWVGGGPQGEQSDPFYAAADLRIALLPQLTWSARGGLKNDFAVGLGLGRKLRWDIVSANAVSEPETGNLKPETFVEADALLLSGGGADWETTLEEALLSLHSAACAPDPEGPRPRRSAALAFSGEEGLGSARFTLDLWNLLEQAEEVLTDGGALTVPAQAPGAFDPAATLARALSVFERLVLLSPGLSGHEEGEELAERLAELPAASQKVRLCAREEELWELLAHAHGTGYRLAVEPLGWRGLST